MANRTILFVDDEANILSSLKRLFRGEPYRLLTASSGKEALALLENENVHIVVSDQRMPEMTGTELLKQVKTLFPHTVRIVLSGYADVHAILAAINQGEVFRFLTKPWDAEELKVALRQCIAQYDLLEENRRLHDVAEKRLTELLALWQRLLEELPAPVLGISLGGDVAFANHAAGLALTSLPGAGLGSSLDDVLPPKTAEAVRAWMASAKPGEQGAFRWFGQKIELKGQALKGEPPRGCLFIMEGGT